MNILFVTLCALETNTSVTKSNYGIIKGLLELGHNVTLLMPEIDRQLSYYDDGYDLKGVTVERIRSNNLGQQVANSSTKIRGIKRKILSLLQKVYKKVTVFDRTKLFLSEAKNFSGFGKYYDVVISTSDPKTSHLFVSELIKSGLKYGRWIQHWGDPLAGDISRKNIYPNFYIEKIEKQIIKGADKVVYVSPFTQKTQTERYKDIKNKLAFVPLSCDEQRTQFDFVEKNKDILDVVYLGDYASNIRNIMPLYSICTDLDFVNLTIAGNTDLVLAEKANIKILPRISQNEAQKLEEKADVIVSIGNLSGNQIPGKLYYAASSKKDILVAIDGDYKSDMKKYLESFNRFKCCENTEESLRAALLEIKNSSSSIYETPQVLLPKNVAREILK